MPSTYSPLLRLELLGAGEQSGLWGDTTNKNLGQLVEQAIAGVTTVSLSGGAGDYTLSALDGTFDESRSAVLKFIGNPSGQKNIIIPTETKLYVVRNESGQTISVKTAAQVTGVTLLNGEATLVFCDGTNAVAGIATAGVGPTTVANGGTGATSFAAGFVKSPGGTGILTSSAFVNASTELTGTTAVANGGTGANTFTAGFLRSAGGTAAITTSASIGLASSDVSGTLPVANGGTGAATFSAGVVKTTGGTSAFTASAVNLTSEVSGTLPVLNGGTGAATLGINSVLLGNGTSAVQSVAPGSAGNILTSNGTTWVSASAPATGVLQFNGRSGLVIPQASDYSGFFPLKDGTGATGTWTININGNATTATSASTVTNGVYTTTNYADPSWITSLSGSKITGAVASVTNGVYTTGSYADPTWITSLSGSKITGAVSAVTNGVYTTSSYSNPSWLASLSGSKITGSVPNANYATSAGSATSATNATNATNADYATSAGSASTANSASSVPWSGVSSKPTTLSGYGITDAVNLSGTQTISGNKTFTGKVQSGAYNITTYTSMYGTSSTITWSVSASAVNNVMVLYSTGNLTIQGTLTQGSDPRIKDDIQDYTKGLDTLSNIKVRSWTYNGKGGTKQGRKAIGVVATEIEPYMPEMVIDTEGKLNPEDAETTTIKHVDALQMTWLLVKSVQELKAEVDSLKAQLAAK